jgi:hypothetical protein
VITSINESKKGNLGPTNQHPQIKNSKALNPISGTLKQQGPDQQIHQTNHKLLGNSKGIPKKSKNSIGKGRGFKNIYKT